VGRRKRSGKNTESNEKGDTTSWDRRLQEDDIEKYSPGRSPEERNEGFAISKKVSVLYDRQKYLQEES